MTNNIFYKVLATIGTLGIILIAGMQVYTTFKKKNNTEAEISKTLILSINNWRCDTTVLIVENIYIYI